MLRIILIFSILIVCTHALSSVFREYERKVCEQHNIYECNSIPNAECEISKLTGEAECVCEKGYENKGDRTNLYCREKICQQDEIDECEIFPNTQCEISKSSGKAYCVCKRGYILTGYKFYNVCSEIECSEDKIKFCHLFPNAKCQISESSGKAECVCKYGYENKGLKNNLECKRKKSFCWGDEDCLNGGICLKNKTNTCLCKENFKGDFCQINELCEDLNGACELIGAKCMYIKWLKKAFCVCPSFTIFNKNLGRCEGKCVHGKYEIVNNQTECRCEDGYEGQFCDKAQINRSLIIVSVLLGVSLFLIGMLTVIVIVIRSKK